MLSVLRGIALILSVSVLFSGCVSLQSVSLTQIPKNRKKVVKAQSSKMIFLGFNFDNDYVDKVREDLKRQCKGKITGILTKDEHTAYFLFFVTERKVSATGFCTKG